MARRYIKTKQGFKPKYIIPEKQGKFDQLHIIETLQTCDAFEV
jgi:hypothetical protein